VRAWNTADEGPNSGVNSFTTAAEPIPVPGIVTLTAPANNAVSINLRPTFTWNEPVAGGAPLGYAFFVSTVREGLFETTATNVTETSHTFEVDFEYETTYYWGVRAFNSAGGGPNSVIFTFTTIQRPIVRPGVVTLVSPQNGATEVEILPTFTWNAPDTGDSPTGYRLYVSESSANVFTVSPILVTELTATLGIRLPYYTEHFWGVIAFNEAGDSPQSLVFTFETEKPISEYCEVAPVTITELIGNFPNPFNPETTISFNLANSAVVNIDIFNVRGQHVRTLVSNSFNAGRHNVVWDGTDTTGQAVTSGVYFYVLHADGVVQTRRMLMLK
jgi:hypothetical protein